MIGPGSRLFSLSVYFFYYQNETELSIKYTLEALELSKITKDYETTQQAWLVLVLVEDGNGGSLQQILSIEVTDQVTSIVGGELALGAFRPNPTRGEGSFT